MGCLPIVAPKLPHFWRDGDMLEACYEIDGCSWQISSWSSCSASCGTGLRTRQVGIIIQSLGDSSANPLVFWYQGDPS